MTTYYYIINKLSSQKSLANDYGQDLNINLESNYNNFQSFTNDNDINAMAICLIKMSSFGHFFDSQMAIFRRVRSNTHKTLQLYYIIAR